MFHSSSQLKNWMFANEESIKNQRKVSNENFISRQKPLNQLEGRSTEFLTYDEEKEILMFYEQKLFELCKIFKPAMPPSVVGTGFHYFKRFYLKNSVMDYHPRDILATCVYLAAKVDEFNVSIGSFVANLRGDQEKASGIILNNELLLMQQLGYQLTIHNPYRPIEGFLIDIKTRYSQIGSIDKVRPKIDEFLENYYFTDLCLIYAPSQIALAAIIHAFSQEPGSLDRYVIDVLIPGDESHLGPLVEVISIRKTVRDVKRVSKDSIKPLEIKLEKCRNQANNPDSDVYRQKMVESLEAEDERQAMKSARIEEETRRMDAESLGDMQSLDSPGL
ncbi:cyclin-H-like isoform X2 [Artemia franciscana]|uniref:cyclin-H-like isoform X2 n=1 Tax=Artemia franciscana TaxID=6661 RepID=UPI0032DB3C0F